MVRDVYQGTYLFRSSLASVRKNTMEAILKKEKKVELKKEIENV